jgi:predicted HAD superfamily Cof-like phosphohydrolase
MYKNLSHNADLNLSQNADLVDDIANFHEKFNIPQRTEGQKPEADLMNFRLKFLAEELREAQAAAATTDLPELLDALVDLVYVAIGTAYVLNMDFNGAWKKVQAANMAKILSSAENPSKRGYANDIVKPAGWVAPDHKDLFIEEDLSLKTEPPEIKPMAFVQSGGFIPPILIGGSSFKE